MAHIYGQIVPVDHDDPATLFILMLVVGGVTTRVSEPMFWQDAFDLSWVWMREAEDNGQHDNN